MGCSQKQVYFTRESFRKQFFALDGMCHGPKMEQICVHVRPPQDKPTIQHSRQKSYSGSQVERIDELKVDERWVGSGVQQERDTLLAAPKYGTMKGSVTIWVLHGHSRFVEASVCITLYGVSALLKMSCYSSTTMCQYRDTWLIYWEYTDYFTNMSQ